MPSKKFIELQDYTIEKLNKEIAESERSYNKLSIEHSVQGLENPLRLREARRDVARLKTELRRRQISEMSPEELAKRKKIRKRRARK
ncbi:MAG TPA: 50S ribosomal protein L29 [Saprospiraceae bacterium]|nr:50S ribosomal protein L29 [Saprospiraceae bacterium]